MARVIPASGIRGLSGHEYPGSPGRYSFNKGKTWLHKNTPPTWRNSPAQQRVNLANKTATLGFTSITDQLRDEFKLFSSSLKKQHMWITQNYTDREAYIRTNVLRFLNDDSLSTAAPLIPANTFTVSLDSVLFLAQQPSMLVTFSHDYPDLQDHFFLLRASISFPSANRAAQKRDYRYAGSVYNYSFAPVQQSPQSVFLPVTPLAHNDQAYIHIRIQALSSDYFPGQIYTMKAQVNFLDYLYYYDSTTYILFDPALNETYFYVNSVHVATLYTNGNLYLKGEVIEWAPSDATLARDSIYYAPASTQLRFAAKTMTVPAWQTCFSFTDTGDLLVYGEVYEFSQPTTESESLLFHPYRNPSYLSFSCDKEFAAMRFNIDPSPQNALLLREVWEHAI
jgi:hypothetical protein